MEILKAEAEQVGMAQRGQVAKQGERKNSCMVSCSGGTKIPSSYTIPPETLENVRATLNEDLGITVVVFKALADPLRLRILKALALEDLCVCVFVELLDCEYSKLSYHLKVLKEAGLVECRPEGTFLIYHLTKFGRAVLEGMVTIAKPRQEGGER